MSRIGTTVLVLCALSLAPGSMADVFVIEPTNGGDCTSLSGLWDSMTSTCNITSLTISEGEELIVEDLATVVVDDLTYPQVAVVSVSGILRLLPGATFNNSVRVQSGGLYENGTLVATGFLQLEPGATGINSGTLSLNSALSGGLQTEGFLVNTGIIHVLANATLNFNSGVMTNTGVIDIGAFGFYNFGTIYNCGGTITGTINDDPPVSDADTDGDGVCDSADCAPENGGVWSTHDAVLDLRLDKIDVTADLSWSASTPGGTGGLRYDVISSTNPADFQTGAICVETDETDTNATDPTPAPLVGLIAYLVRTEGVCGPALGDAPVPRSVRTCP